MKVVILRGVSGAGKSRYAKQLIDEFSKKNGRIVSADLFFTDDKGNYKFDARKLADAHKECLIDFIEALREGVFHTIVVDNTNTRATEIAPYYAIAEAYGAFPSIVTVLCPLEEALRRNIHGTPANILFNQYQRLLTEALPPWWKHEVIHP